MHLTTWKDWEDALCGLGGFDCALARDYRDMESGRYYLVESYDLDGRYADVTLEGSALAHARLDFSDRAADSYECGQAVEHFAFALRNAVSRRRHFPRHATPEVLMDGAMLYAGLA